MKPTHFLPALAAFVLPLAAQPETQDATITGELRQWHKVTLTFDGPEASETGTDPNPFTDFDFRVTFTHQNGDVSYTVPGYFAADGDAAETSAEEGDQWRVHFSPDRTGRWDYEVDCRRGEAIIASEADRADAIIEPLLHGKKGSFTIEESDKAAPDFRARGRLAYVGKHHLRFLGDQSYFLKAGADAPETLLAYADFDGTKALKPKVPLKTWEPHVRDWKEGDPVWQKDKGKGLIGALNYLSAQGMNSFSFLPYNVDGDGSNVWPFTGPRDKLHYDCSKLDQWAVVFDHATARGLHLHFKMQENEIDDNRKGLGDKKGKIEASLDGGELEIERKLYCRELIARFGHALALNWNLGEENTQIVAELKPMATFIRELDPYDHPIVLHTYPNQQDRRYTPFLGKDTLTGLSLQNPWNQVHSLTAKWRRESAKAGHPWVCANDEQNPAGLGVPPDPGYPGKTEAPYSIDDIRKLTLWGNLMAGGAGVEYYFGYQLAQNDLLAEDWRSREMSWKYARIALEFFRDAEIPFEEMTCRDELIGNPRNDNSKFCLARAGGPYLVYLPDGGSTSIRLPEGKFKLAWFNPRTGETSAAKPLEGRKLEAPDKDDWLAVIRP
ncbi:hypothetical protein HAHE_24740 [Haloferula helveola]|uniref:DUF5060 domain-containing protein n=1 Tax=Haloferula helveola TaxID=490095 RepID=A0ABM7RGX3_9BACT|nr:hypothetical protein HAHE_24740 [Haloferula helveola]